MTENASGVQSVNPEERAEEEAPKLTVIGEWLCAEIGRCNCAGGFAEVNYAHEPHCGFEPLETLDVLRPVLAPIFAAELSAELGEARTEAAQLREMCDERGRYAGELSARAIAAEAELSATREALAQRDEAINEARRYFGRLADRHANRCPEPDHENDCADIVDINRAVAALSGPVPQQAKCDHKMTRPHYVGPAHGETFGHECPGPVPPKDDAATTDLTRAVETGRPDAADARREQEETSASSDEPGTALVSNIERNGSDDALSA